MAIKNNNTIKSLFNASVNNRIVLPPFKVQPFPDKLLKMVPELKEYQQQQQRDVDQFLVKCTLAIRGGAS